MMRAISCLTFAYLCAVSGFLFWLDHDDLLRWIFGVLFLVWPILISWALANWFPRTEMRGPMLVFAVLFCLLTVLVIDNVYFSGEHDAQYGLVMLAIPAGGLIGLIFAGLLGVASIMASKRP